MKRLLFLVEGNPEELNHFSGIPHFFTRALLNSLAALEIEVELIETSYLFNVEELLLCLEELRQGRSLDELLAWESDATRRKKLLFPLNQHLLREAAGEEGEGLTRALRRYYERVAEHLSERLQTARAGDCILSQNHFYPYLGEQPHSVYYFLDTSLVDFYFRQKFSTARHRREAESVAGMYEEMERRALRRAAGIFCFSERLREDLHERYALPLERTEAVGAGINLEEFPRPIFREPRQSLELLFVGLDFARKGGLVLLAAMESLRDEAVRLSIVTRAGELSGVSLPPNVRVYPPLDKEQLGALYRGADVFVFPTQFEPFGIVICEAMSYSLPVIASRVFAVPEILGLDERFLLVEPEDAEALGRAIRYLIEQPALRSRLGKYNYLRSQRLFQWKHVADKIILRCLSDSFRAAPPETT